MIDKEQYEALQKKEKTKITYSKIKKMGITCGACKWSGKVNSKMEKIEDDEKGYDMCFYNYPNLAGPIGLRGARANNSKNMYCGMAGKFFYPKSDEAAGIKDRAEEKARLKAELKEEMRVEAAAELKKNLDAQPAKPGDEELPVQKSKKSKPGQG